MKISKAYARVSTYGCSPPSDPQFNTPNTADILLCPHSFKILATSTFFTPSPQTIWKVYFLQPGFLTSGQGVKGRAPRILWFSCTPCSASFGLASGIFTARLLFLVPPPHVLEHWVQASHASRWNAETKSTRNSRNAIQKMKSRKIYIYIPGTQMTPVLLEKGLVLKGSTPKIEDKQVPGIHILCTDNTSTLIYLKKQIWLWKKNKVLSWLL